MRLVFFEKMAQMRFAENDKVVEALAADAQDTTFGEGVHVRRPRPNLLHDDVVEAASGNARQVGASADIDAIDLFDIVG
jgi:hypothetical protein